MSGLNGANDYERLQDLCSKPYKQQACWFLNAFWEAVGQENSEKIWSYVHYMQELDTAKKAEGNALDEMQAHRFLEKFNETMTVQTMRDKLRSTGAITNVIKMVPLIHILIFKYSQDWHTLVNAPQGNREEIDRAQKMLDEVSAAFQESEARAHEAAAALREAQHREAVAKKSEAEAIRTEAEAKKTEAAAKAREAEAREREADAIAREDELRRAQEELEAALAEVKAQEDAYNNKTEQLKRASEEGGLVQRNKAKNELAQHLGEDPLPLRRAKITAEAAVKKADKATQAAAEARVAAEAAAAEASNARAVAETAAREAEAARAAAEEAAREAEAARVHSEAAARAAEHALEEARKRLEEAEAYLEEVKARIPHGTTWWMERELYERRKYLPKSKGGIDKH